MPFPPPQDNAGLASLTDIFPGGKRKKTGSNTTEPGPRLVDKNKRVSLRREINTLFSKLTWLPCHGKIKKVPLPKISLLVQIGREV